MLNYTTLSFKSEQYSEYLKEKCINLLDSTFDIIHDFDFDIVEVTKDYIARPDLLSYEAYGDDMYADVICKLNGISNPFELNEGMLVVMPSSEYIDKFTSAQRNLEEDQMTTINELPIPKVKTTKRKANEAVVGDSRFKVDKNKRVIIY